MRDITSDSLRLKVSALEKAFRVSATISEVTLGPDSVLISDYDSCNENVENEPDNRITKDVDSSTRSSARIIPTRSGLNFSIKKILLENELQRKEEVRLEMQRRLQSMEESGILLQKQTNLLRETLQAERERLEKAKADELARLEAEEEHIAQQVEMRRKHEQQLHAQRIKERQEKREREAAEHRQQNKERRQLMDRMILLQASFRAAYQDISSISGSCKDRHIAGPAFAPHSVKLKELSKCMEGLVEHAKMGNLTEEDVSMAELLVKRSKDILNAFRNEIDRINAAYDAEIARREEEVRRVQAQEQYVREETQKFQSPPAVVEPEQGPRESQQVEANVHGNPAESSVPEATARTEAKADGLYEFVDKDSLQLYRNSKQLLENHRMLCSSLISSDAMKKFRFECQKAINIPVNTISGTSSEHLFDKFEKLHSLLAGKPPINANQHPQGIAFCKYLLAKKFASQGESLVSSNSKAVFPQAAVAVALWSEYPDFGELLLACFHKTCPYLVPIFLPQQQNQSNDDYYKSLGYKYTKNGILETGEQFLNRMSGVTRLYIALTVTRQRRQVNTPHPHGLHNAWRWLAAILNIEPRPDICATLILDALEVAGNALWRTYPNQFRKLLTLFAGEYYPRMQNMVGTGSGPMARLEEFLKKCLTEGSIPPPNGQLPLNFW